MPDFAAIARQSTRNEFAATFPFPFLVGATPFVESRGSIKTLGLLDDVDDEEDEKTAALSSDPRFPARGPKGLTVLAVRKMTGESPEPDARSDGPGAMIWSSSTRRSRPSTPTSPKRAASRCPTPGRATAPG